MSDSTLTAVLARLSKWIVVLTLTLSLGLHWPLLQSVAWLGMVVKFSNDAPLTEALSKTFDGKHPCQLCKLVREGKAKEQKKDALKTMTKFDMLAASNELLPAAPVPFPLVMAVAQSGSVWRDSPPTPPPRSA